MTSSGGSHDNGSRSNRQQPQPVRDAPHPQGQQNFRVVLVLALDLLVPLAKHHILFVTL